MAQSNVVLITGCSSGIGRALAEAFNDRGWRVWATARDPTDIEDLDTAGCTTAALDVTDDEQITTVIERLLEIEGQIDCLINNAGYGQAGAVEDVPLDRIHAQFDVNVYGVVRLIKAVLPQMRAQGDGTIINVSSFMGQMAFPLRGIYAGSKHALEGISDALRKELDSFGIDVILVEPGTVNTNYENRTQESMTGFTTEPAYEDAYERIDSAQRYARWFGREPKRVATTIYDTAVSEDPKPRYIIGWDAKILLLLNRLPFGLLDRMVSRFQ